MFTQNIFGTEQISGLVSTNLNIGARLLWTLRLNCFKLQLTIEKNASHNILTWK
jgi:hypothetical protein